MGDWFPGVLYYFVWFGLIWVWVLSVGGYLLLFVVGVDFGLIVGLLLGVCNLLFDLWWFVLRCKFAGELDFCFVGVGWFVFVGCCWCCRWFYLGCAFTGCWVVIVCLLAELWLYLFNSVASGVGLLICQVFHLMVGLFDWLLLIFGAFVLNLCFAVCGWLCYCLCCCVDVLLNLLWLFV